MEANPDAQLADGAPALAGETGLGLQGAGQRLAGLKDGADAITGVLGDPAPGGGNLLLEEGIVALMQLAKVSVLRGRLSEEGLPFLSVMLDPSMGLAASLGLTGDIVIAERGARIGLYGPDRLVDGSQEGAQEDYQRAESLLNRGLIDLIVHRKDLKERTAGILQWLTS